MNLMNIRVMWEERRCFEWVCFFVKWMGTSVEFSLIMEVVTLVRGVLRWLWTQLMAGLMAGLILG
jgi:hypothetical protein